LFLRIIKNELEGKQYPQNTTYDSVKNWPKKIRVAKRKVKLEKKENVKL